IRYLSAYRLRVPTPQLIADHDDFGEDIDEAIDSCVRRLKDRLTKIRRLEEQVMELGGAIVVGLTQQPPPLQRPNDRPEEARAELDEDCLPFEPENVRIRRDGDQWLLTNGRSRMKLFSNLPEARLALSIIRHYRLDRHCFVGRPDPSMEYFLVDREAPEGAISGEDCIGFDASNLEVREANGRWTLAEGDHLIMGFPEAAEAEQAIAVIRKYGFDRTCYVGRPGPSMVYLRR
ncbi:MAG: hypothetical protein ACOCTG_03805, partial [Bacteroidota bacterium]